VEILVLDMSVLFISVCGFVLFCGFPACCPRRAFAPWFLLENHMARDGCNSGSWMSRLSSFYFSFEFYFG